MEFLICWLIPSVILLSGGNIFLCRPLLHICVLWWFIVSNLVKQFSDLLISHSYLVPFINSLKLIIISTCCSIRYYCSFLLVALFYYCFFSCSWCIMNISLPYILGVCSNALVSVFMGGFISRSCVSSNYF